MSSQKKTEATINTSDDYVRRAHTRFFEHGAAGDAASCEIGVFSFFENPKCLEVILNQAKNELEILLQTITSRQISFAYCFYQQRSPTGEAVPGEYTITFYPSMLMKEFDPKECSLLDASDLGRLTSKAAARLSMVAALWSDHILKCYFDDYRKLNREEHAQWLTMGSDPKVAEVWFQCFRRTNRNYLGILDLSPEDALGKIEVALLRH